MNLIRRSLWRSREAHSAAPPLTGRLCVIRMGTWDTHTRSICVCVCVAKSPDLKKKRERKKVSSQK